MEGFIRFVMSLPVALCTQLNYFPSAAFFFLSFIISSIIREKKTVNNCAPSLVTIDGLCPFFPSSLSSSLSSSHYLHGGPGLSISPKTTYWTHWLHLTHSLVMTAHILLLALKLRCWSKSFKWRTYGPKFCAEDGLLWAYDLLSPERCHLFISYSLRKM